MRAAIRERFNMINVPLLSVRDLFAANPADATVPLVDDERINGLYKRAEV